MTNTKLKEHIKNLPAKPGIYLFSAKGGSASSGKNRQYKPLYIGKALNLKNRVSNYLKTSDTRIQKMISESDKLDYIKTDSDIEALILESQYIKKFRPDFNIVLRDDKQYSFVVFTDDEYPKIFTTHQPQSYGEFIGPFTDAGALKTTLLQLRKIFPYCTCKQTHNNYCLNYHIGKCLGFCCLKKPETDNLKQITYKKNVKTIKDILSGEKSSVIENLEKEMKILSYKQEYEQAMELQYKIERIKRVFENAQIIQRQITDNTDVLKKLQKILKLENPPHRIEAYDIANIQGKHAVGAMAVFIDGVPDKNEYRKFKIYTKNSPDLPAQAGDTGMLKEILTRRFKHPEWQHPELILVDGGKGQFNVVKIIAKNIPVIAMVKNENHIGTKIITDAGKEIPLYKLSSDVKNLLLHIDTEVHRFAISYYRKIHRKSI